MLKKAITISFILPTIACGPDTVFLITQEQELADLPVQELEYLATNSQEDENSFPYAERIEVHQEEEPIEEVVSEEEIAEEEPAEEEVAEEEPVEEEAAEEEFVEEEVVEEEPVEEEVVEEEFVEEVPAEEEQTFSGECELNGNIYNFSSTCQNPTPHCLSRHTDNANGVPETGFCGKVCFGHSNCPGEVQCVMNGVTPGVGYCER
jgi:hypothetical protein